MALGRPRPQRHPQVETATAEAVGTALVAAASPVKLDTESLRKLRVSDQEWQREAWRHYDINGELRFLSNRHANAVGRVRIFIADVDDDGSPAGETTDPDLKALASTIFGGPMGRARGMRQIALNNYVAGECFMVAESRDGEDDDLWYVISASDIRKQGGALIVNRPDDKGGGKLVLRDGKDLLIRVWTQHPRNSNMADSSVRAALPILREVERLTMLAFSQIDSRLISAGLLLLPQGIDFPHQADKPGGVQGLLDMLLQAAEAQLKGAGTAAGLVPLMAEVPAEAIGQVQHIKFETTVAAELKDKLEQAIGRLARSLDCEPEDLLGHGKVNHWSGWLIDENTIKLFIEPVVQTICDAWTESFLKPYAKAKGKDPAKFVFWFDSSGLTVRPNRFNDAKDMWDRGELTASTLRREGNFDDGDEPDDKERLVWRLWNLVEKNPNLLSTPAVAKALGLPVVEPPPPPAPFGGMPPDAIPGQADQAQLPAGGQGGDQGNTERGIPQTGGENGPTTEATQARRGQPSLTASARWTGMLPGAELVVLRALELAGGKLVDHHERRRYADVARFELHTRRPAADTDHARALLAGAFTYVPTLAQHHDVDAAELEFLLSGYCAELLARGHPHDQALLAAVLERADRLAIPA